MLRRQKHGEDWLCSWTQARQHMIIDNYSSIVFCNLCVLMISVGHGLSATELAGQVTSDKTSIWEGRHAATHALTCCDPFQWMGAILRDCDEAPGVLAWTMLVLLNLPAGCKRAAKLISPVQKKTRKHQTAHKLGPTCSRGTWRDRARCSCRRTARTGQHQFLGVPVPRGGSREIRWHLETWHRKHNLRLQLWRIPRLHEAFCSHGHSAEQVWWGLDLPSRKQSENGKEPPPSSHKAFFSFHPTSAAQGCGDFSRFASRQLVFNWSSWVQEKYPTADEVPWHFKVSKRFLIISFLDMSF